MSTLTNTQIRNTYDALLKLADNGNLTTVLKEITDGLGNVTPLSISQIAIKSSVDIEASGFKTPTGTSSQFLKADGSIDSSTYLTSYIDTNTQRSDAEIQSIIDTNTAGFITSYIDTNTQLSDADITALGYIKSYIDTTYVSSDFNHNDLSGVIANEHIDWTGASAGTIHITNLPATAITSVQIASTQVAMLALTTQEGDVVVRSDENKTYMHNGGTAGTMADFTELSSPTGGVSSVDGATGAVVLDHDTLAGFVANEHIDWTSDQGATNIHAGNYTNTTYTNVSEFTNDAGYTGDQDLSGYSLTSHNHTFASLTSKPTTIAGYGITDGIVTTDARLSNARTATLTGNLLTAVPAGALFTDTTYDLSGYLLNTTDTLTGDLTVTGDVSATEGVFDTVLVNTVDNSMLTDNGTADTALFKVQGSVGYVSIGDSGNYLEFSRNATNYLYTSGASSSLSIGTAGVEALRLSSNQSATFASTITVQGTGNSSFVGNVGIGTDSPNAKLEVDLGADGIISQFVGAGSDTLNITGQNNEILLDTRNTLNGLAFGMQGSTKMRIDTDGNVGIGTDSPNALLDIGVNNIITLDDTGSSTGFIGLGSYNDGTKNRAQGVSYYGFGIEVDRPSQIMSMKSYDSNGAISGSNITLNRLGNVGIGTDSPDSKLNLEGFKNTSIITLGSTTNDSSWSVGDRVGGIDFYSGDGSGAGSGIKASISYEVEAGATGSTNSMVFRSAGTGAGTNNTERMRIDNAGNVGIGTDSPDVTLEVSTDSLTNNVATLIGGGWVGNDSYHKDGGLLLISGTSQNGTQTGAGIAFQTRTTADNNYWKSSIIMDRDGAMRFIIGGAGGGAGSEDFTILANGNVGIGTDSPSAKLDVKSLATTAETVAQFGNNNIQGALKIKTNGNLEWGLETLNARSLTFGTNNTERMRITSAGNVTMTEDLKVDGEAGIGMINNTGYNLAVGSSNSLYSIYTDGRIYSATNASALLVSGRDSLVAGQNITSSSYALDVLGESYLDGDLTVTGNVTATDFVLSSDIRLKKDLLPLYSKRLSPSRWTWKDSGKKDFGFIAQELEVDFPEVVVTGEDGFKKVAYNKITAINSARINELEDEVSELKRKLELIMQKLDI